ncbi:tyrosine--tRNA ligase [Candidatus Nomurabacteria bacterium]|nr:tyrosine--tRNA ligase [Candidatus Kaiserbacteria bacterium]MCB9815437.1 tyrosine--tRNA ligase [Candidatus Nomurabacteria bacterium]
MSLSQELLDRGFINQFSTTSLEEIIDGEKRTIYHGIDPTADSAHAGNFVVWMLLRHMAANGHKIIFLIGGATGMIGDPKPEAERQLKSQSEVEENVLKIKTQAEKFFAGFEVEFVNNYNWFKDLTLLDFLRDIGKHYTVNELIKKDAISTRLQSETGLSYTEFAYPLIQGFDFYQLFQTKNCTIQVGGSDQWGNMVSGVELVRRKLQKEVAVITVPLIVDKATGRKFGKSEGNAVWLDGEKTSPYKFYQFWLNINDDSVVDYLKLFTLLPLSDIEDLKKEFEVNPGNRVAQKHLAFRVTELVHGEGPAQAAQNVSEILFGGRNLESLTDTEKGMLLETAPSSELKKEALLVDVLVETKLATSKREARMFIESGAVEVNGEKISSLETKVISSESIDGLILLKRGKKQLHIIKTI